MRVLESTMMGAEISSKCRPRQTRTALGPSARPPARLPGAMTYVKGGRATLPISDWPMLHPPPPKKVAQQVPPKI